VDIDSIKAEYYRIRSSGMDARTALAQLRPQIVRLELSQREQLLEQLRLWEIGRTTGRLKSPDKTAPRKPVGQIKPLSSSGGLALDTSPPGVTCPHCGKANRDEDVFCFACGQLLSIERGLFDTRHFVDDKDGFQSDEYFGPDMVLVFAIKETQKTISIRPQDRPHEIIVGRGTHSTMKPDIDLTAHNAVALGVSRLHLNVVYNEKRRTLSVSDLGSANGTYINGVRLHPEEVRVLRHGDELRLGKLTLTVYFHQQGQREK